MDNIIKFHSSHPSNYKINKHSPEAVKKHIPSWYLEKDKHIVLDNGYYETIFWKNAEGKTSFHRKLSWKSCPAILDIFTTGYYMFTPCDIEIRKNMDEYEVLVPKEYQDMDGSKKFCDFRREEKGFPVPYGYSPTQFVWRTNWYPQVPEGYTVLMTHPMNVNDLPFKTLSGFVDCAKEIVGPGNLPFYIQENWEGVIPAGTPYVQVIPIKNESWSHEIINHDPEYISNFFKTKFKEDVIGPSQTKYKQHSWLKKNYE